MHSLTLASLTVRQRDTVYPTALSGLHPVVAIGSSPDTARRRSIYEATTVLAPLSMAPKRPASAASVLERELAFVAASVWNVVRLVPG